MISTSIEISCLHSSDFTCDVSFSLTLQVSLLLSDHIGSELQQSKARTERHSEINKKTFQYSFDGEERRRGDETRREETKGGEKEFKKMKEKRKKKREKDVKKEEKKKETPYKTISQD